MDVLPSLVLFTRDLRTQKLRTFFALLGITWGTAAVVLLLAFGAGLKRYQSRRLHGVGDGIVVAWPLKTSWQRQSGTATRAWQITLQSIPPLSLGNAMPTGRP